LVLKKQATLESCGHEFHEDCLKEYVEKKVEGKDVLIFCPRKVCATAMRLVDLMDFLDAQKQEKYVYAALNSYVESMEDVNCCPTPTCHYAFLKSYKPDRFHCSLCDKQYCMKCHVEWHHGFTCEEHQKKHKVEEESWQRDPSSYAIGKFKQCLNCKHWACKKYGTKIIQCQCGHKLCYCCGRKKIKGDCQCPQTKEEDMRPIVQPELFHKIMASPPEFKKITLENRKGGKTSTKGGIAGNNHTRANVDEEIELHITGNKSLNKK